MQQTENDAENVLPQRPEEDWRHILWGIISPVIFGGLLFGLMFFTLPSLVGDWQVRATARPVMDADITGGTCSATLSLTVCNLEIALPVGTGSIIRAVNYVFLDIHNGDYAVDVVVDPAQPHLPTTDLGLAMLWNRTLLLLVATIALVAASIGVLRAMVLCLRLRAERRAFMAGQGQ